MSRVRKTIETAKHLLFKSLKADCGLGFTLTTLAFGAAAGSGKRIRIQAKARKAYNTVLSISKRATLSGSERQELGAGLDKLKSALEALGEHFQDDVRD